MRRSIEFARLLMVFTALTSAASLASGQEESGVAAQAKPAAGARAVGKGSSNGPLPERACRVYASEVVKAVGSGNMAALNALIDWDSLCNTVLNGMDITAKLREDLTRGLKGGFDREAGLSGQIVKNSQQGGTFDFLRIRQNHDRQVILFRMIQPVSMGGVAYFEFVPGKSADGKIRATDLFIYSGGEFFSDMLRRGLLPIIAKAYPRRIHRPSR